MGKMVERKMETKEKKKKRKNPDLWGFGEGVGVNSIQPQLQQKLSLPYKQKKTTLDTF